jgi:hypothetical protein
MSGRKTITVDSAEWARLRREANKLRDVQRNLPKLIDGVREQAARDLERNMADVKGRQRQFDRTLAKLSKETRELERSTNRRLAEQASQLRSELASEAGALRKETRTLLAAQDARLRSMVEAERQERTRQVAELKADVGELQQDRKRALGAARTWLSDARTLADYIATQLPHARFAPGELAALERRLEQADDNVRAGLGEAGLASAQSIYHDLSDLQVTVTTAENRWLLARDAASSAVVLLEALVTDNALLRGVDESGAELSDVDLDVDFWTNGGLTELHREVDSLLAQLRADDCPLSTEELRRIAAETVDEFTERLADLVQAAKMRQLASQLRVNIADTIVDNLIDNNYELVDGTYAGEDYRGAFFAKVTHLDGSEVVVIVEPTQHDDVSSLVRIESFDTDTASEEIRQNRARELAAGLRRSGLDVGDPTEAAGTPDPAVTDLDSVRRTAPQVPAVGVPSASSGASGQAGRRAGGR